MASWKAIGLAAGAGALLAAPWGLVRPDGDALLARLQDKIDRLESLTGRFVQRLDSRSLGRPRTESGRFALRKPSLMRWEYETPERKLAIIAGRRTWLYLPEEREVHRGVLAAGDSGAAALSLLAGRLRFERDFAARRLSGAELAGAGPQGFAGAVVLELTPRKPADDYEKILLGIDPALLQIRRVTVVDALGGRMVFEFLDLDEDVPLADDLFVFEIPSGVVVIDEP